MTKSEATSASHTITKGLVLDQSRKTVPQSLDDHGFEYELVHHAKRAMYFGAVLSAKVLPGRCLSGKWQNRGEAFFSIHLGEPIPPKLLRFKRRRQPPVGNFQLRRVN